MPSRPAPADQATARDLPGPVRATGGALVLPTRVATATASYTPSSAAQLQSSDGTLSYSYTPLDQLSQVDDAAANRTTMTYDSLGRKTRMDNPDMGVWDYTYDVHGNLKTQTDAAGQVLWFGYDALDRPTEQRRTIVTARGF